MLGNLQEFAKKGPLEALTEWSREFGGMYKCFLGIKVSRVWSVGSLQKSPNCKVPHSELVNVKDERPMQAST